MPNPPADDQPDIVLAVLASRARKIAQAALEQQGSSSSSMYYGGEVPQPELQETTVGTPTPERWSEAHQKAVLAGHGPLIPQDSRQIEKLQDNVQKAMDLLVPTEIIDQTHILGGVVSGSNCGFFIVPTLLPRVEINSPHFGAETDFPNVDTTSYQSSGPNWGSPISLYSPLG